MERVRRWNASKPTLLTTIIVVANVVVFLLGVSAGGLLGGTTTSIQRNYGLFGPAVANGEWYRVITSGFVHYGLIHLGMNMLFIWQLGGMLERTIGRPRYALIYVASLLGGSAGALLLSPLALTAGASGAAFGLMGAAAMALYRRGLPVLRSDIGSLLILNLIISVTIPGISLGGHVGGLIAGAMAGSLMVVPHRGKPSPIDLLPAFAAIAISLAVCWYAVQ